jgi:hypothetical protein
MWEFNEATGEWEYIDNPNAGNTNDDAFFNTYAPNVSPMEEQFKQYERIKEFEEAYPEQDFFESTGEEPILSPADPAFKPKRLTGEAAERYREYVEKTGQTPYIGADIEDLFAEDQSVADQWANGSIKFLGKTATNVAGGLLMIPGLVYGAATGSFKNVYDNAFQRALDDANAAMDEYLPNYVRKEVEDYSLLREMFTANFWANDVLSGMSFVAGAVLTEMLTAGMATPVALGRTTRALKAFTKTSKVGDATRRLNTLGNLNTADEVLGGLRKIGTGTFYEAGVEARHYADEARTQFIEDFIKENGREPSEVELAEAMDKIYNVANGVFAANSALVSVGNMITLPTTFGPKLPGKIGRALKQEKDKVAKGLTKTENLSNKQLARASKRTNTPIEELKKQEYIKKSDYQSNYRKAFNKVYNVAERPVAEGIFEEMGQGTINATALDYVAGYLDVENKQEQVDLAESFAKGLAETYGSKEGWKEGILGAIIGGAGFVGPSSTGKGLGWQGGIWESLGKDKLDPLRDEYILEADASNPKDRIKALVEKVASQHKANQEYSEALESGDMFSAKNAEHEAFFSEVEFRMRLGDYQAVETMIEEYTSELSDEDFMSMFGYENMSDEDISRRKDEVKQSLLTRARSIRKNINKAKTVGSAFNEDIRRALAYSMSSVDNLDEREASLAKEIAENLNIDERSLMDAMRFNNAVKGSKGWLNTYEEELNSLQEAEAKLTKEQLKKSPNEKAIEEATAKVEKQRARVDVLVEREYEARKANTKKADIEASYLDFDAFKEEVDNVINLKKEVEKYYFDNKFDIEQKLKDLEKLAARRQMFVNEVNRLASKKGAEAFNDSIKELLDEAAKFTAIEEQAASDLGMTTAGISVNPMVAQEYKLRNVQEKLYDTIGKRLNKASISDPDGSMTAETPTEEEEELPDLGQEQEQANPAVAAWIKEFNEGMPPSYTKEDTLDVKIGKTKAKLKYAKEKLEALKRRAGLTGTENQAAFNEYLESGKLQKFIGDIEALIKNLENSPTSEKSLPILFTSSSISEVFISDDFVDAEGKEALGNMTPAEIAKSMTVVIEDYAEGGVQFSSDRNPAIQITKGVTGQTGKGAYVYVTYKGKKVRIGGLADPNRFTMPDGSKFSIDNFNHVKLLNPSFVAIENGNLVLTKQGEVFTENFNAMVSLFDKLTKGEEITPEFIKKTFFVKSRFGYNSLKDELLENRPSLEEYLDNSKKEVSVAYSYKEKGKEVSKSDTIVVSRRADRLDIYVKEGNSWRLLNEEDKAYRAIQTLYENSIKANPNLEGVNSQFALLYPGSTKGTVGMASLGFPSVTAPLEEDGVPEIVDGILKAAEEQVTNKKSRKEGEEIKPVTVKDSSGNNLFLSIKTSAQDKDGNYIKSNSSEAEISVVSYEDNDTVKVQLQLSSPGSKEKAFKAFINLKLSVKDGKLYFFNEEIKSLKTLIEKINGQIKYYHEKNPENQGVLDTAGKVIKIGNILKKIDAVNDENTAENLSQIKLHSAPVFKLTLNARSRTYKKKVEKEESGQDTSKSDRDKAKQAFKEKIKGIPIEQLKDKAQVDMLLQALKQQHGLTDEDIAELRSAIKGRLLLSSGEAVPGGEKPESTATDTKDDVEKAQRQLDNVESKLNPNANHPKFNVGQKHDVGNIYDVRDFKDERKDTTQEGVDVITKIHKPAEVDADGNLTERAEVEVTFFDSYEQAEEFINAQYNKYKAIAEERLAKANAELAPLESTPTQQNIPQDTIGNLQNQIDEGLALGTLVENSPEHIELERRLAELKSKDEGDEAPFSISQTEAKEKIDIKKAEQTLARMLNMRTPENPNGIFSMDDVRNLLNNVRNNGITWGAFYNNVIYLSKKAGVGTEYHEAFHAVFRTLLSPTQINSYYFAARKAYGNPTLQDLNDLRNSSSMFADLTRLELEKLWLEEQMAEAFKKYALEQEQKPKGILGILYHKIKKLLGFVKSNKNDLDILFQDIYSGKFRTAKPYNKLQSFRKPAFALLKREPYYNNQTKSLERGFLNKDQSERIINTLAIKALQLKSEKGSLSKRDILDLIRDMSSNYYSVENFRTEIDALVKSNKPKAVQIVGKIRNISKSLSIPENEKLLTDEIEMRLQVFDINTVEENAQEESFADDAPERAFDVNIAEVGGFVQLSKEMRKFIAFSSQAIDEFGFGELADLSNDKFQMASNPYTIYTAVQRGLQSTHPKDMLSKLKNLARTNSNVAAFYDHLTTNINLQLEDLGFENFDSRDSELQKDIEVLQQSALFSTFASAFALDKAEQLVVLYDKAKKDFKTFKSNTRDVNITQFNEWAKAFINSGRNNMQYREENLELIKNIRSVFTDSENIESEENLSNAIQSIKNAFSDLGINLSEGYIRFSILSNHVNTLEQYISKPETPNEKDFYEGLLEEVYLFSDVKPLTKDDLTGLSSSIAAQNNPFVKNLNESDTKTDRGAIGRLQAIAENNAVFDESVGTTTFQNAKGQDIYSFIQKTYLISETKKWNKRTETAKELLRAIRDKVSDDEGALIAQEMFKYEGTPYPYYIAKKFYQAIKHNPYLNGVEYQVNSDGNTTSTLITEDNEAYSLAVLKQLQTFLMDGLRTTSLSEVEVDGEAEFVEDTYKNSDASSYAELDGGGIDLVKLSMFAESIGNKLRKLFRLPGARGLAKDNRAKERTLAPFITQVNSDKNTQTATNLPVHEFVNRDGELNTLGVEFLFRDILQEYEDLANVQQEIKFILENDGVDNNGNPVFDIEGYHYKLREDGTKDYTKGKGHDFFLYKAALQKYSPELYQQLLADAREGKPLTKERLEPFIQSYAQDLFGQYLETLASPARSLIRKEETTSDEKKTQEEEKSEEAVAEEAETVTVYKNKMLPKFYEKNDGTVNITRLKEYFFNDMLGSMAFGNLIHGNLKMSYKDMVDFIKRMSKTIAAGPPLGTGTTKVAVVRSVEAKDRFDKDSVDAANIKDLDSQDTTDAQNIGTLSWYRRKYLTSLGKKTKAVDEIYNRLEKGYKLTPSEIKTLKDAGALVMPRKIVGTNRWFYDKTSIVTLLRSQTSYVETKEDREQLDYLYDLLFDARRVNDVNRMQELYKQIHAIWKPIPSERLNHDTLNYLESTGTDILAYDSSMKGAKINVGSISGNNEVGFIVDSEGFDVDDEAFKEQVKTDNLKSKIIDPIQALALLFSEQKSTTKVSVFGTTTTLGDLQDAFENLVSLRTEEGFKEMQKIISSNDKPRYTYLLKLFKESLMQTGADSYLIEMVSAMEGAEDLPKYNLNMPSTIDKLESMFLSFVSKNVLKNKAPGHKFTLRTDHGTGVMELDGKIITDKEFRSNPSKYAGKVTTRRLAYRKKDADGKYYTEIKISAQFAEHLNLKKGDELPPEILEMYGVRIPTDDKHSMGYFKVVDFLPMETGNEIIMPYEILKLSGADFDVDAEYVRVVDYFIDSNDKIHWFGQYLKADNVEEAIKQAREEYIREKSQLYDVKENTKEALLKNKKYQEALEALNNLKSELNKLKPSAEEAKQQIAEILSSIDEAFEEGNIEDADVTETSDDNLDTSLKGIKDFSELTALMLEENVARGNLKEIQRVLNQYKSKIQNTKNFIRTVRTEESIKQLDKLGYSASEDAFNQRFSEVISANRSSFEKGNISAINPLTITEINNLLVPVAGAFIYNDTNEDISNEVTSTEAFDKLEKRLREAGVKDNTEVTGIYDPLNKTNASVNNATGTKNIGPVAVFNLIFQRLAKAGVSLSAEWMEAKEVAETFKEYAKGFKLSRNQKDDSILNNVGIRVNNLIGQNLNAMTDNGKDPKASKFNMAYQLLGTSLTQMGLGKGFNEVVLSGMQPAVVQLVNLINADSSPIKEGEYSQGFFKLVAKTLGEYQGKDTEEVALTEDNLIQALLYAQDPTSSTLTEAQYNFIQVNALQTIKLFKEVSDFLRNFTDIIGLAKGAKPTFSENYNVQESIKNLGLRVVLRKDGNPQNLNDYSIEHVEGYAARDYPLDLLDLVKKDKILSTNLKAQTAIINHESPKFFLLEAKPAKDIVEVLKTSLRPNTMAIDDKAKKIRKSLLSFLSMRAYKHQYANKVKGLNLTKLFDPSYLHELYAEVSALDEFGSNEFLGALLPEVIPFKNKATRLDGHSLYKMSLNTRTKNNPDYVQKLMDSFRELYTSENPKARLFAARAFYYLLMKDGGLFKNDSFIRQIAPHYLTNISNSLDEVQDLFAGLSNKTFVRVFGISKGELIQEFVDLYARYQPNGYDLRTTSSKNLFKDYSKDEEFKAFVEELKQDKEAGNITKEQLIQIIKQNSPVFKDDRNGVIRFDLYAGVEVKPSGAFSSNDKMKMGINAQAIKGTGLVSKGSNGKLNYPAYFKIVEFSPEGIPTSRIYRLYAVQKQRSKVSIKDGLPEASDTVTLNKDGNLFNEGTDVNGVAAYYKAVNPILTKEISPFFWTIEDINAGVEALDYIREEKEEQTTTTAEEQQAEATTLSPELQNFLNQLSSVSKAEVKPETKATPTEKTPVEKKEEPSPEITKEYLLKLFDQLPNSDNKNFMKPMFNSFLSDINENKDKIESILKNLGGKNPFQSKSSEKQTINREQLSSLLDKLSAKFGIDWEFDTSIPGLGQFKNGRVLINPDKARLDTPFHEFAHPFVAIVKLQNPLLYKNLTKQVNNSELGKKTLARVQKNYPELSYEEQVEEAIVDLIGQYAADLESVKQEKGLWNAIKTFLRKVSEYIKSLLADSKKAIIPSELNPETTLEDLASMLVVDNPVNLGRLANRTYRSTPKARGTIKPGVQELFDSNPELANQVYEALGFVKGINELKVQDFKTKIGEATQLEEQVNKLKKYVEQFRTAYFVVNIDEDIQSDIFFIKEEAEEALKEYNNRGNLKFELETTVGLTEKEIEIYKDVIDFLAENPDQNPLNEEEYTGAKKLEAYLKYKHEITSKQIRKVLIGNKEKERLTDFITINLELSQAQKIEGESGLPNNLVELELSKITPQQKQQALQLYSQYLDTIFPDSKVKDIVYHGTNAKFDKFDKSFYQSGADYIYFGKLNTPGFKSLSRTITAIINLKNPSTFIDNNINKVNNDDGFIENYSKNFIQSLSEEQFEQGEFLNQYGVEKPEQIHILGSQKDIEGFRGFVNNQLQAPMESTEDRATTLFSTFVNVNDADVLELLNNCN